VRRTLGLRRPDAASLYAASGTILRTVTGPVTLIVVAATLTKLEQGFYYTFFSVFGAYQMIEAGMGFVATQAIGRRMNGLRMKGPALDGDEAQVAEVHARIGFVVIWLTLVALVCALPVYIGGVVLFNGETRVDWAPPWGAYVAVSAIGVAVSSLGAVLEGIQRPQVAFGAQLAAAISTAVGLWCGLAAGLGLFALPLASLMALLVGGSLQVWALRGILPAALRPYTDGLSAGCALFVKVIFEIWPFFSRIAVTWSFGFFYWNALPLLTFACFGAEQAGRRGVSIALLRAGMQFTESFLSSQRGRLSALLSSDPRSALALLRSRNRLAHATLFVGYALFFAVRPFLPPWLQERMLPTGEMAIYAIGFCATLFPLNAAVFLRCTGREIFFRYSLALNLLLPALLLTSTTTRIPLVMAFTFTALHIVFLPWAIAIWRRNRPADGHLGVAESSYVGCP
jgi:hypothetical protein